MNTSVEDNLALEIKSKALTLGYENCGIIKVEEMADYTGQLNQRIEDLPADRPFLERFRALAEPDENYPWARSIVVLVRNIGIYKTPDHLSGHIAKSFLVDSRRDPRAKEHQASLEFEKYLTGLGLKTVTGRDYGLTALRLAAERAGLGRIRRNNFFYTETGSYIWIEAWLIDRALELKGSSQLECVCKLS